MYRNNACILIFENFKYSTSIPSGPADFPHLSLLIISETLFVKTDMLESFSKLSNLLNISVFKELSQLT